MTPHEKHSAIKALENAISELRKMATATPCFNCIYFSAGYCEHWKDGVPSDIIARGCEAWVFDEASPPF